MLRYLVKGLNEYVINNLNGAYLLNLLEKLGNNRLHCVIIEIDGINRF